MNTRTLMMVFTAFLGVSASALSAQTISMPTQGDITAAQLTALDARLRLQQQQDMLDRGFWPDDFGFDNQFMPDQFNNMSSFGGGGGGGGPNSDHLSPSMMEGLDNDF